MNRSALAPVPASSPVPRSPVESSAESLASSGLPRWLRTQFRHLPAESEAAFAAGAALALLDHLVRSGPPELGAWRTRQALAAASAERLRTDVAALRDAEHLTRAGDDPGPAGRLHRAWRRLASQPARQPAPSAARLAELLGISAGVMDASSPPDEGIVSYPIAAAAAAAELTLRSATAPTPEIEILAWMMADLAVAQGLGRANPVPLLATTILHS